MVEQWERTIASLTQELLAAYEELSLLYETGELLGSVFQPEQLLHLILQRGMELIGAPQGAILLLDQVTSRYRLTAQIGLDPQELQRWDVFFQEGSPCTARTILNHPGAKEQDGASLASTMLFLPLTARDRTLGALALAHTGPGAMFSAHDLKLATTLGNQAALMIDNAFLLQHYLEKQRWERELEVAREIQRRLLPQHPPQVEGFDMATMNVPCAHVGGDYYDFISLADDCWSIAIGDVAGHGLGAALLMSALRSTLRALAIDSASLAQLAESLNAALMCDPGTQRHLITLFYATVRTQTPHLTYVNAGHDYPFIIRGADEAVCLLHSTAPPIGILERFPCRASETALCPGDVLVLYTDGVTESRHPRGERFGLGRLVTTVRECRTLSASAIAARIHHEVFSFAQTATLEDDMACVIVKVL